MGITSSDKDNLIADLTAAGEYQAAATVRHAQTMSTIKEAQAQLPTDKKNNSILRP